MDTIKYTDIIKFNNELRKQSTEISFNITILSNIMVHYVKDVLEYVLREQKLNPSLKLGDYDNIIQNSGDGTIDEKDIVIIFWELSNLMDGLQYKIDTLDDDYIEDLTEKLKSEIDLVLKNLENQPLVIINYFTSLVFNLYNLGINKLDTLASSLNHYLDLKKPKNVQLVNLDRILAQVSVKGSVNFRDYYASKSLYTIPFFKTYSEHIAPIILSIKGKSKKAIIFDCDNTLWKGIIGEDGIEGIKMSAEKKATTYEAVQYIAKSLCKEGVILGLCSKNNFEDVNQVIDLHQDFCLTNDEIVIKKVNWSDKISNLKEIAEDLNIGIDSFVFVDDSDFEVNLVREQLPEVTVVQVPTNTIQDYPELISKSKRLFFNVSNTTEDLDKAQLYKKEIKRKESASSYENIDDYIMSLGLVLEIFINQKEIVPRLAQLTQKTNQFNLTTKRYTEQDILNFMDKGASVIAFSVKDRFGESGITGLAILIFEDNVAIIDSLLMSCRILGRNIEYKFFDELIKIVKDKGVMYLKSSFVKTLKNTQVATLYDKQGFMMVNEDENKKLYQLKLSDYIFGNLDYIKILNFKK
jgi:FkbH-like protein